MSDWDVKLLKYGDLFEQKMMDLSVNIPLEEALDLGWQILASCFTPEEAGLGGPRSLSSSGRNPTQQFRSEVIYGRRQTDEKRA